MTYDTIIVLSTVINPDGTLFGEVKERVDKGIELFNKRLAGTLTMSGRHDGKGADSGAVMTHAEAMKKYAMGLGITEDRINLEDNSIDTVGQAILTRENVVKPKEYKGLVVVTHDYHLPRVKEIFNFVFGAEFRLTYEGIKSDKFGNSAVAERENESIKAFRRTFEGIKSGDKNLLEVLVQRHPLYKNFKIN